LHPKVDQTAGKLNLAHVGIIQIEKIELKHKNNVERLCWRLSTLFPRFGLACKLWLQWHYYHSWCSGKIHNQWYLLTYIVL